MSDDGKRIAQARDAANMAIQELSRWAFCHLGERDEALAEVERLHGVVADGDEALARSVLAEKEAQAEVARLKFAAHAEAAPEPETEMLQMALVALCVNLLDGSDGETQVSDERINQEIGRAMSEARRLRRLQLRLGANPEFMAALRAKVAEG